jgi:hypothetical protein
LRLLYTVWGYQGHLGGDQIIEEKEVVIPRATVKGIPDDWYRAEDARHPNNKLQSYRSFMFKGGMGAVEQITWVNQILAEHPESADEMLDYKIHLVKMLESPEAAFELFEQHRLDALMYKEGYIGSTSYGHLSIYLLHLYNSGQKTEFNRLQQHFLKKQTEVLSSKDRNAKFTQNRIKNFDDALPRILYIPQVLKQIQAGKGPEIVKTIKSSDGVLFIEMEWPIFAKGQNLRRVFNGPSVDKATLIANDFLDAHTLYQYRTNEKELVLDFQVEIESFLPEADGISRGTSTRFAYPMTVQIPPASDRTADQTKLELDRWHPAFAKRQEAINKVSQMSLLYRLRTDAQIASQTGDYEQAIELYRSAMDCNIPEDLLELGSIEEVKARVQSRFLLDIAQCRIKQGNYTEARDLAQQMQGLVTANADDQRHPILANYYQIRDVVVQIALHYIELHNLDQAQALLEQIGKHHPDLRHEGFAQVRICQQRVRLIICLGSD